MSEPTKAFYERDPYTALLRNLTIMAIDAAQSVIAGERLDVPSLIKVLELDTEMSQRGVVPNMHVLDPDDPRYETNRAELARNPRRASEWVAGQMRQIIARAGTFADLRSRDSVIENSFGVRTDYEPIVAIQDLDPRDRASLAWLGAITALELFVDYGAGLSDLPDTATEN